MVTNDVMDVCIGLCEDGEDLDEVVEVLLLLSGAVSLDGVAEIDDKVDSVLVEGGYGFG